MAERKLQARWLALLGATAVALYGCWLLLQPFVGILTWAIVLVVTFYPVHRRLLTWTGRRGVSALASTALVLVVILTPLLLVVGMMLREVPDLARKTRDAFTQLLGPESPLPAPALEWLDENVGLEELRSPEIYLDWTRQLSGLFAGQLLNFAGGIAGAVILALLMVYAIYYLFRDGEPLADWLRQILPLEEVQNAEIIRRTREMIGASVYGVIVLGVLQGTLGGLAFLVLGLPNPFLWGAVMIVLSTIPVAGSFVIWVPAALYLAATGQWGKAALLTAWGTLVIGLVDNFLRPKLMGQKARMHELLLFFSVLGGLVVFGVAGLVLGPVLVAVALGLLDVIRQADRPAEAILHEPGLAEQSARISDGDAPQSARPPAP